MTLTVSTPEMTSSMSDEMVFQDVLGLVHFVHATSYDRLQKRCGGWTVYLPRELSDSWTTPVTCLQCIAEPTLWIRPLFRKRDVDLLREQASLEGKTFEW